MRSISKAKRFRIYLRDGFECSYCNKSVLRNELDEDDLTIDHIKPKSKGGTNNFGNLTTACKKCNNDKCSQTLKEYRKVIEANGCVCAVR